MKLNWLKFLYGSIIVLSINTCSVNTTTGLITFYNLTQTPLHNIKIGDHYVSYVLNPGERYDYWFFSNIGGKIEADEINSVLAKYLIDDKENHTSYIIYKDNPECVFMKNFEYHIDAVKVDNQNRLYVNPGMKSETNTEYDYPARSIGGK